MTPPLLKGRMQTIEIAGRQVGDGHPVFIVAEIGYNFNTLEEGKASIDAAVAAGVDAVKFQSFKAETVTSRHTDFPTEAGGVNQFEEFKRYEMSQEAHRVLFDHAREQGTVVFSTPGYYDDVDLLEALDAPVHKVGSDDLTNLPFLAYVASIGRPIIFSTGMGTLTEVSEAFDTIVATGNRQIVILHCASNYPIKDPRVVNLNAIRTLRRTFGVPVGFSDHTMTTTSALGAVALGASVIERHFTLDKKLDAPDAFFSADPAEMTALVSAIRELECALGDGVKRPSDTERDMRLETRKSVVARVDIGRGELITQEKIIVKRPGIGIPPKHAALMVGRRAARRIDMDHVITWGMLD